MQGGEEKHATDGIEEATLDEAERARIETARAVLQVVAEAESAAQASTGKGGGAPAHGLIVPGFAEPRRLLDHLVAVLEERAPRQREA